MLSGIKYFKIINYSKSKAITYYYNLYSESIYNVFINIDETESENNLYCAHVGCDFCYIKFPDNVNKLA